jgi:Tfp pilus assembly protein PilE
LELNITRLADTNYFPDEKVRAAIIHYAYADERWYKRHYFTFEQAATVWDPVVEATAGSILDEIMTQIRQAGDFYRDPFALKSSV